MALIRDFIKSCKGCRTDFNLPAVGTSISPLVMSIQQFATSVQNEMSPKPSNLKHTFIVSRLDSDDISDSRAFIWRTIPGIQ